MHGNGLRARMFRDESCFNVAESRFRAEVIAGGSNLQDLR
jgi:hypothetical protein